MSEDEHIYDEVKTEKEKKAKREKKDKKKEKKHVDSDYVADLQRHIDELKLQLTLKCEILTETDKKNAKLFDENKQLKFDMKVLEIEKEDVVQRLKVAGFRKVDTHLLSPDIRRSWIGERWESLYKHEWTAAYEELCNIETGEKRHVRPERQLLETIEWCFNKCCALAIYQTEKIYPLLIELTCHLHLKEPVENKNIEDDESTVNTLDTLKKSVHHCQHESDLLNIVKQTCIEDYISDHKETFKTEVKFVTKCMELCWLMQISDPQLTIEFKNLEGTPFNSYKFNQYSLIQHNTVGIVVWPALLMVDNGQVVCKGIVRTISCVESSDSYCHVTPENDTQGATNKQDTTDSKLSRNDYMTMEYPKRFTTSTKDLDLSRESFKHERINPFNKEERPNTHYLLRENSNDIDQSSNSAVAKMVVSGNDRKQSDTITEESKADFSHLSKSANHSDFKGSFENLLHTKKIFNVVLRKKKTKPKDGRFVSYLAGTRNSSTL